MKSVLVKCSSGVEYGQPAVHWHPASIEESPGRHSSAVFIFRIAGCPDDIDIVKLCHMLRFTILKANDNDKAFVLNYNDLGFGRVVERFTNAQMES